MGNNKAFIIDVALVHRLVATQFPQWQNLTVRPVSMGGWDNRTFHLGENMLVRMPSTADYAAQVEKEQYWLPKLAPLLFLPIPTPVAIGKPSEDYPWRWSIYRWLPGENASVAPIHNLCDFAVDLANFLRTLQSIDSTGGPPAGLHSFYRGGSLIHYDADTRRVIAHLKDRIDASAAIEIWETALASEWQNKSVWVHGDISAGNLLVQNGKLSGIIDFGQLAIGDPACDLAIAWTLFTEESRAAFQHALPLDADTWVRGRAWAIWKALITAAGFTNPNNFEAQQCWRIISEVLTNDRQDTKR
jgi:aminoglycoside phosphotransferase (APT) family kinase protein